MCEKWTLNRKCSRCHKSFCDDDLAYSVSVTEEFFKSERFRTLFTEDQVLFCARCKPSEALIDKVLAALFDFPEEDTAQWAS